MQAKNHSLSAIFQETEQFLRKIDPKKCSPPYITTTFASIREKAYAKLMEDKKNDNKTEAKVKLGMLIDKFEIEYIETLREKLNERYAEYIQQKSYDVPSGVDFKELKNIGATDEATHLARSIAEWSLELEILSYTIEGLKLYGLKEIKAKNQKDYISALKQSYTYKKETGFLSVSEYLLRRLVNFSLARVSSLALVGGVSKVRFGTQAIFQIFMAFSMTNQIPWRLIIGYMNLPWLLGGFACSFLIKTIQEYARKDEIVSNLQQALTTFESNKLHLMSERSGLIDLALKIISSPDDESYQYEMKNLSTAVDGLLAPSDSSQTRGDGLADQDIEKMFEVKEMEDYFLVEEKDHKEYKDDSGVLVIDW